MLFAGLGEELFGRRNHDPKKPFFLNVWFHEPHQRIAAPDEIVKQYGNLKDQAAIYSATIDNTDRAIAACSRNWRRSAYCNRI